MKFSEIAEPEGGYKNNTTSYYLVLDIALDPVITSINSTGSFGTSTGTLYDPNGISVGFFKTVNIVISSIPSTMTVWNGTSMESEPINFIVPTVQFISRHNMLVPPGYTLKNFDYAIGFWLTEEEVEQYILHGAIEKEKIQIASGNIIGPTIEEKTANQSQEQNPNNIGKYLIGGPRW
ncbi:MAG: hypothetical protein QXE05_12250 [Nitrososphaeria archaeon]